MTRSILRRTLRRLYLVLGTVLALSLVAKLADQAPGLRESGLGAALKDIYEYIRDMSLLIATGGAAYIANVFQKRSGFVESLEEEWRGIVRTKSALYAFCEKPFPTVDDYIAAFCRISETIDNMRIVYRNVGETDALVGLYPYAPLHDMRRALQTLDPRQDSAIAPEQRQLARDAILQCFYALRESFLDELDLEEPDRPLLISRARRSKKPGSPRWAVTVRDRQRRRQDDGPAPRPDIDDLLGRLYEAENKGYPDKEAPAERTAAAP